MKTYEKTKLYKDILIVSILVFVQLIVVNLNHLIETVTS